MNQSGIEGDLHHYLEVCLSSHFRIETGVVVLHEPGRLEVVPDEPVASSVPLGRRIHEEMNLVKWNEAQKIPGGGKVLFQTGPVPEDDAELPEFPSTSSKSSWIS